jgi:hypothetical protein
MIKQFAKLLIIAGALSIAALPAMSVAKTCHQEAKEKGIKGKKEVNKFVHECLEKRRSAKKSMTHKKKVEHKKEEKKAK